MVLLTTVYNLVKNTHRKGNYHVKTGVKKKFFLTYDNGTVVIRATINRAIQSGLRRSTGPVFRQSVTSNTKNGRWTTI